MANEKLKQTMNKEWQNVRKRFHYPQLPQPKLVDDIPNGVIDIQNLEIKVSESFITSFEQHGIENEEALNECLTHELTHFMRYPGSVLDVLKLQKAGQGLTDGNKIGELRAAFTEAQTNIYLTNEIKHPSTARMRKAYGLQEGDEFGRLMYGLYQEVSQQDFGIQLKKEEKGLVNKLKEIDFLDKKNETYSFRQFVQLLKEYEPKQNKKQKNDKQGESQGNPCSGTGNNLGSFTENQIREGLKQFAQECSSPGEYEEIVRQVLGEGNKRQNVKPKPSGNQPGIGKGIFELAENFYTALAEKYLIPVRKKPMHKNGSLYPHSHTSFQVGDSITEVDAFSTPGILPGITKKWVRKEGEVYGNDESVPDSFIVIDNSGSMPNPKGSISLPVLGATAISNAYLNNNSSVAVYNFGGDNYLLQPSKNREPVHRQLRIYTGGGTTFNSRFLEEVLKENEREFDVSVVSDMAISNLDSLVKAILKLPKTHRIHLIYTKDNNYVNHLRESFSNVENVAILPLINEEDIYKITMGELKKSVK